MMKEAVGTGESVEEAFEAACKELGVESHEAEFEILEMPVKKTFGLFGGSPARVRAFIRTSPADAAVEYLRGILDCMQLSDIECKVTEEESGAMISLSGNNIGFIIGHRGETLDSLQYLAGLVANHIDNTYYRITLDIGNYREKRKETLDSLGKKIAVKAIKTGRNCSLEPMNPYERRIIHTAVQEVEGAKSWSEGEDAARHVVIGPEAGERFPSRRFNDQHRPGGDRRTPYRGNNNNRSSSVKPEFRPNTNTAAAPRPVKREEAGSKAEASAQLYGRIEPKNPQ